MSPPEKSQGLSSSSPPRAPLSDIELLITLDRLRGAVDRLDQRLGTAEANDKRFEKMETHFTAVKWFAGIAVAAALVSLINGIAARMSWHISDAPPIHGAP
jgi:hypothetical protein